MGPDGEMLLMSEAHEKLLNDTIEEGPLSLFDIFMQLFTTDTTDNSSHVPSPVDDVPPLVTEHLSVPSQPPKNDCCTLSSPLNPHPVLTCPKDGCEDVFSKKEDPEDPNNCRFIICVEICCMPILIIGFF